MASSDSYRNCPEVHTRDINNGPWNFFTKPATDVINKPISGSNSLCSVLIQSFYPHSALESFLVIGSIQAVNTNAFVPGGGMNEFIIPYVNSDVSQRSLSVEENKITFRKILTGDADADFGLLTGIAGQCYIKNTINFLNEG